MTAPLAYVGWRIGYWRRLTPEERRLVSEGYSSERYRNLRAGAVVAALPSLLKVAEYQGKYVLTDGFLQYAGEIFERLGAAPALSETDALRQTATASARGTTVVNTWSRLH